MKLRFCQPFFKTFSSFLERFLKAVDLAFLISLCDYSIAHPREKTIVKCNKIAGSDSCYFCTNLLLTKWLIGGYNKTPAQRIVRRPLILSHHDNFVNPHPRAIKHPAPPAI